MTFETYAYDGLGRLVVASDSDGNDITFTYNTLGQLASETNNGETLIYTYDDFGNLLSTTYPTGREVTRSYDSLNRLTQVLDGAQSIVNYGYDTLNMQELTL